MEYKNPGALVTTDWLAVRLKMPRTKVIDASWYLPDQGRDAKAEYRAGHIPGAVFWDLDEISDRTSSLPHTIPPPDVFSDEVTFLNIDHGDHIVVYDGMGMFSAPRVWWMFRLYGYDEVSVLDGGFPKWKADGREIETGPMPPPNPSLPFPAGFRPRLIRSLDQMKKNLETGEDLVLDARGPARFAGTEPEPREGLAPGHIPGSRNLHYASLLDPETGLLKDADALDALFRGAGVTGDGPVACTCGSGVTAAMLAFGLHLLGHENAAVYDGSWAEWGSQPDTTKATGAS